MVAWDPVLFHPSLDTHEFVGTPQNCLEKRWGRVGGRCWCSLVGKQNSSCAGRGSFVCQKKFAYSGIVRWVVSMTFLRTKRLGPLVLLENFPDMFRGSLWLHFLDKAAASSNLANGSSSVIPGDILIGATWSQIQRLQVFPRFDRVDPKSNPVDGLSRGRLDGPWKVESLAFTGSLLRALRLELGGREGSQVNTLLALLIREGGSTSEHREVLCAVVPVSPRKPGEPLLLTWVV